MKPTKKSPAQNRRKPLAKPVQKHGSPGKNGRLTREETTNLILQAQEAFHYQTSIGNIEPGTKFDDWRRDQIMDSVGKNGISQIDRSDWRTVKALFLELSNRADEAFTLLLKTGHKIDHPTPKSGTWESCEIYVHQIHEALANHAKSIATHPKGHLSAGWLIAAARQRTGKPTLTIATLAERLDPAALSALRNHLISHIAIREGRAKPELRAKRIYPKKPNPHSMAEDDPF